MKPTVLIIDDDRRKFEDTPLVWELEEVVGKGNVKLIENPIAALDYISANLSHNLIVLLDIEFPGMGMNGHELLSELRKLTEIIPVIIFSGTSVDDSFVDLINNHAFAFVDKHSLSSEVVPHVSRAIEYYENSLENTLEDWIENQDEDKDKPIFYRADGTSLSLNEILHEVRMQTKIGKEFARKLNELSIDLLLRNKRKING